METLMTAASWIWSMSIESILMILAVLMIRMVLIHRLPKRTFSLLWTICGVRMFVPMVPETKIGIYSILSREAAGGWNRDLLKITDMGMVEGALKETADAAMIGVERLSILHIAGAIWLLGVLLFGGYFLKTYVKYRRIFAMSLPLKEEMMWKSSLWRKVTLRVSDRIETPLSYGLIRPVILFPAGMDWKDRDAMELILAHEEVHIRWFDGLSKGLFTTVLCLHWWNPLAWILCLRGNRDGELACDEAVVLQGKIDRRREYAMTLIHMEERRSVKGVLYSHFSENAIEERINAIMKMKKTSGLTLLLALCLVISFTVVFGATAPQAPEETGFLWPAEGCELVTMTFGERLHPVTGETMFFDHITISAPEGEALGRNVIASEGGTVTEAGYDGELGNYLTVDHGNGFVTKYTHCEEVGKEIGDVVSRGDVLGTVGNSGKVTGPCLGFYVYEEGVPVDPTLYF